MPFRKKNIKLALLVYWLMVLYFLISLSWWYIELNDQNIEMANHKINDLQKTDAAYQEKLSAINKEKTGNFYQFIGEGALTLVLILAGAAYLLRQFKNEVQSISRQQSFLTAITHELKTPIAISKLNLETIQKHKLTTVQLERLLYNTLQETNRMDSLCNNLLVSRQIDDKGYQTVMEDLNFSTLVNECIDGFTNRFPQRDIKRKVRFDVFTKGDKFLLQMGVNNLIENAIKYSPKDKAVEINLYVEHNSAVLKVIDEGCGILEEDRVKIFKKYYRVGNEATKSAKGTGLGLFIVKRITQTHDAKITMKSNPIGGTIFTFTQKVINQSYA
jgi:two-component system, OmpR family, sensor histidine kinase CiaH